MINPLYIDYHILQSVPPSNINRDDSGSPKQAQYGGVRRSRVSSQAWKRATRTAFAATIPTGDLAVRTKQISTLLTRSIQARTGLGPAPSATLATALLAAFDIKAGRKDGDTAYLLFFGRNQVENIVSLLPQDHDAVAELAALDPADLKAEIKKLPVTEQLRTGHPIDVALFGRMVADLPGLNVTAAVQVAHALSTHAVTTEFDYYTAVDDEPRATEDKGAGMIGNVEFNSATLYRYATLAIHLLRENLDDDDTVVQAATTFTDAFIRSMPTGHANTFAHRTLPHLAAISFRTDQPVNLVSAYERPVHPGIDGIADTSALRLADEHHAITSAWSLNEAETLATYTFTDPTASKLTAAFGQSRTLADLITGVRTHTQTYLSREQGK